MRVILCVLFFTALLLSISGFIISANHAANGDLYIGLGVVTLFFIWMPTFIYHRWKNKKIEDYMLNEKNIYKMRNYTDNNKL
jgi:hypothetical protein